MCIQWGAYESILSVPPLGGKLVDAWLLELKGLYPREGSGKASAKIKILQRFGDLHIEKLATVSLW